jgi:exportin-1
MINLHKNESPLITSSALLNIPPQQFKLFMDSITWAIKHTMRDIADIGLNSTYCVSLWIHSVLTGLLLTALVAYDVIHNFSSAEPSIRNSFFQQYFLSILQEIFFVLTDSDHKSGFKLQSILLQRLFQLVETDIIQVPLFDPAQTPDPNKTNSVFLREYTANLLQNAFPHLNPYVVIPSSYRISLLTQVVYSIQIQSFVNQLSTHHDDLNRFKLSLRDFLIQMKEFSGDNTDLYLEEKEAENQRKLEAEREAALRIPGMVKPSLLEDKDEDI